MPSIPYMNRSAPFWDFVASLEQQGNNHPFFSQNRGEPSAATDNEHASGPEEAFGPPPFGPPPFGPPPAGPWGWGGFGRGFPFRPGHGPRAAEPEQEKNNEDVTEKEGENDKEKEKDNGEGPSCSSDEDGRRGWGRKGRCGGRGGRRHGERAGPYEHCGPRHHGHGERGERGPHGWGHHGHGHHGRRGGWGGPWGRRGGPFGGPFNPMAFIPGLFDNNETDKEPKDFEPEADVFDTESAFVVHIALPGAKKEDVGVNWDAEKSELSVAGVIYRPGDEEFLKTLAMSERNVGPFERKVRLGTRANPAQIDADMITAKLEDGVLRIEVPKMESGFVEVRKVDIL